MKKLLFFVILTANNLFAVEDSFFKKERISKDELIAAVSGDDEDLLAEGVTSEILANAFSLFWEEYYGRKIYPDEVAGKLRSAEVKTLPAGTKIIEAIWKNGKVKKLSRTSLEGEEFLVSQAGNVLASLRCGNPCYSEQKFLKTEEKKPEEPLTYNPPAKETLTVVKEVPQQSQSAPNVTFQQPQVLNVYWPLPTVVVPNYYPYPSYYPSYPSYSSGISFGIHAGVTSYGYGYGYYDGYKSCQPAPVIVTPVPACQSNTVYGPRKR